MQSTKELTLQEITNIVSKVVQAYDVKQVHLFGSYARGEETEKSDIDLRIDMVPSEGLELWGLWQDLEDNLGKKIDLLESNDIPDFLHDSISQYEVLIYESNRKR